jgi:uncharacterized protein YjbI with pentapeptide repeats
MFRRFSLAAIIITLTSVVALSQSSVNLQTLALTKKCEECSFLGDDLSFKDFSTFAFWKSEFNDVNITGTDLSSSNLSYVKFSGGTGQSANFAKSELIGASFKSFDLRGSNFQDASGIGLEFVEVQLDGANLRMTEGATKYYMTSAVSATVDGGLGVEISFSDFSESDFSNSNFRMSKFTNSRFINANFEGSDLEGTDFSGSDLSGANLFKVNLTGAILDGTNLCKAIGPDGTLLFIGCN